MHCTKGLCNMQHIAYTYYITLSSYNNELGEILFFKKQIILGGVKVIEP